MKYFFIFFFVLTVGHSQTGKITYSSIMNFGVNDDDVKKETYNLYFNDSASLYQAEVKNTTETDKIEENKLDSGQNKVKETSIVVGSDSVGDLVYNNLKENYILCRESVLENQKLVYYLYEDPTALKWQLVDSFKKISGYKCQKAITAFRGRNYEAWFTSEISLSFGPWKFGGLPGLILEVYDNTGQVYFNAENIVIPYKEAQLKVIKPNEDQQITHQEYVAKSKSIADDALKAILARLPKGTKINSTKIEVNGLEMDYPWDKD